MEDLWGMLESILGPGRRQDTDSFSGSCNLYLPFVYFSQQHLKMSPSKSLNSQFEFDSVQATKFTNKELEREFSIQWELPSFTDCFEYLNVSDYGNATISEVAYEDIQSPLTAFNFTENILDDDANKENGSEFFAQSEREKLITVSVKRDEIIYHIYRMVPDIEKRTDGKPKVEMGEKPNASKGEHEERDQDQGYGGSDESNSKTLYDRFYEKLNDLVSNSAGAETALDYRIVKVSRSQEADKLMSFFLLFRDNIKIDTIHFPLDAIGAIHLKTTKETKNVTLMSLRFDTPPTVQTSVVFLDTVEKGIEHSPSSIRPTVQHLIGTNNNIARIAHQVFDNRPLLKSMVESSKQYGASKDVEMKKSEHKSTGKGSIYTMYRDKGGDTSGDDSDDSELGSDNDWTPYQDVNIIQGENYVEPLPLNSPYNTTGVPGQRSGKPSLGIEYAYGDSEALDMRVEDIISEDDEEMKLLIEGLLSLNATDVPEHRSEGERFEDTDIDNNDNHSHSHSHSHGHGHGHGHDCGHGHGRATENLLERDEDDVSLSDSYLEDILDLDFQDVDFNDFRWENSDKNED